ncbi:MAG TPA: DEAD/DEAH box helicase family protein, partial [Anaerolineae bacterium]|nr:DEAD/DEAH box helicase family protein [Anaerolineae bacterium]
MPMQFKFDGNQDYQLRAIESVVKVFDGQPLVTAEMSIAPTGGFAAIPNRLDLDATALLANLHTVQTSNELPPDDALRYIDGSIETVAGEQLVRFPNFSVEMETGTGKTYVYLRTALELFRSYGMRKFIIVVPSIAVREGVLKALQITAGHLRELYGNLPYRYQVYDSANLTQVRHFADSDSVEIMVMTIDSFNRASNVIRQSTDRLQGETPIHLVQAARPILILDEPQNMESELRVQALAALHPLFALRYSATHRNPYNLVYRLTPYEAYQQGLVKKVEVASVVQSDDENRPFLRLESISTVKNTVTAKVAIHCLMADGTVKERVVRVRPDDTGELPQLQERTKRPEYAPYRVDEISKAGGFVRFANGHEIRLGETQGVDKEAIFSAQIRETIEEH